MSLRSSIKKLGRKTAKVRTKVGRVLTPVAAAGAGFLYGAPGAAAVTAVGAQLGYYNRATQARNEGKTGRDARSLGRGERKRVAIYGAAAGGAGMLGSGALALAKGATFGQATGLTLGGQHGAALFGNQASIFAKALPSNGSSVPGLVTQADLNAVLHGGTAEASGGSSAFLTQAGIKALDITKQYTDAQASRSSAKRAFGSSENEHLLDQLLGGGGGGGSGDSGGGLGSFFNSPAEGQMSPALIAALAVGAFLLLA